jgi:hypothetical protein
MDECASAEWGTRRVDHERLGAELSSVRTGTEAKLLAWRHLCTQWGQSAMPSLAQRLALQWPADIDDVEFRRLYKFVLHLDSAMPQLLSNPPSRSLSLLLL